MVNSGIGVVEDAEGVQVMYTASKISLFIPPLLSVWIKTILIHKYVGKIGPCRVGPT